MMVLSDMGWIIAAQAGQSAVTPFDDEQTRTKDGRGVVSSGLSSAGYDLRLCPREILIPKAGALLDPKWGGQERDAAYRSSAPNWNEETGEKYWDIHPLGSALALTVETIEIPRNYIGLCIGKSTYARCGLIVNTTPLEPEWRGRLVLELHNIQPHNAIRIYGDEGIAQLLLLKIEGPIFTSYADRRGKYQDQREITPARV